MPTPISVGELRMVHPVHNGLDALKKDIQSATGVLSVCQIARDYHFGAFDAQEILERAVARGKLVRFDMQRGGADAVVFASRSAMSDANIDSVEAAQPWVEILRSALPSYKPGSRLQDQPSDFQTRLVAAFRQLQQLALLPTTTGSAAFNFGGMTPLMEQCFPDRRRFVEYLSDPTLLGVEMTGLPEPEVVLVDATPELVILLREHPLKIHELSPHAFEQLVANRLEAMGMHVILTASPNRKDGGIDFIAYPEPARSFPFLLAGQVKHHRLGRMTGVGPVREIAGVAATAPFHAGLLVTNTDFTLDAKFFAKERSNLVRLRGFTDLCRWIQGKYDPEQEWSELSSEIEIAPGLIVKLPRY